MIIVSVFEAIQKTSTPMDEQSGESSETIEWYKTQLEQYQQAINDWQVWSENQMKDVATMQESLAYYTSLAEEHSKLKSDLENTKEDTNAKTEIEVLKAELDEQKSVIEQWNTWATEKTQEINQLKSDNEELQKSLDVVETQLKDSKTKLEQNQEIEEPEDNKLKEEMEQQRKVLEDWNAWALQKTEEYNQLLEAYNQYVVSYQALETEIERLKVANTDLEAKVKENNDDQKNPEENQTLAYQDNIYSVHNHLSCSSHKNYNEETCDPK